MEIDLGQPIMGLLHDIAFR